LTKNWTLRYKNELTPEALLTNGYHAIQMSKRLSSATD